MREFLKIIGGIALGLAAALLIAFNALLLWVATGPRSLNALSPYIAASLSSPQAGYHVKIGQTWLIWEGWQHPIDIQLRQVEVLTKEGQIFSRFPEISLGVNVLSLPLGCIEPTSLTIQHPVIRLFQNEDRSISFGFRAEDQPAEAPAAEEPGGTAPIAAALAPLLHPGQSGNLRHLHAITILDADVNVGNHQGVFFRASGVKILFHRNWKGVVQISTNANIAYADYESALYADFQMRQNSPTINGHISVYQFMPGALAALFSDNPLLGALKLPVNGKAFVAVDMSGALQRMDVVFDGGKGSIETTKLDGPLPVSSLHAEATLLNNASAIQVKKFTADLGGMALAAAGSATLSPAGDAIYGDVTLKNVPASQLHLLWPPDMSPQSRAWVTGNVTEGVVPQAVAHIAIAAGDLAKPILPSSDIDATIDLIGAKIRYLPDHPEVRNVKGSVHVDAVQLKADIASGDYMKDTKLSNGHLLIADLNADNPYITLHFNAETSAKDAVRVLSLPRLQHAKKLGLSDETAQGSVKGSADLGFHFFAPHDAQGHPLEADVDYDIKAELKNVSQPGFMKKFDVSNASGSLSVNHDGLEFKGSGGVNGASISAGDIKYLFKPDKGFDTFIDVTATAPVEAFPRFGYPSFGFLQGNVGVKANVKEGDTAEQAQAVFNLAQATVSFPEYGWIKPQGEAATFDMTEEKKEGAVSIPSFHLTGNDMEARGAIELNKDLSAIRRMTIAPLRYGHTDLDHFVYEVIDGGWHIEADGKSGDLTAWMQPDDKNGSSFSFAHFPALQLKAQLGQLILGKDSAFTGFKADVDCNAHLCARAEASGQTSDGKPFHMRIGRTPKGGRELALHAANAGAFLKSATIFDGMQGGELTLEGTYGPQGLKGTLDITEHTIKGAPILARILSVASLTGFFDTLQGKGISFTKLHAPFTLHNDVITLEEAKTHGPALGMTAGGTITFPARTLDIAGTIVPSYTLNHVLGNVPLVGTILTGEEGGGIFAVRYHVTGSDKNPEVTVNPLSMLTPGFLRGVFDIFDSPKKKE